MCAIAGMIDLPSDQQIIENMEQTMLRRGPDGSGYYTEAGCTLLHTRLAIIDPENGAQPMHLCWQGEHYVLTYNGELYNTREITEQLVKLGHSFETRTDTEVVLRAYAQWGEACLAYLNGIFAFGIWEERRRRLFLARDRMGVKPLFYMRHQEGLLFASEIKTILAYPGVAAQLDEVGAAQILLLGPGRMPGSGVFKNMYEIEPGCCAVYDAHRLAVRRYWSLKDRIHGDDFDTTAEKVRYLVSDAIKRQMVSDVPIGTFLSGGLDSSIISAICAEEKGKDGSCLDTFSVDYTDNDRYFVPGKFQPNADGHYIRIMESHLQSRHHWTMLSPQDLYASLEDATLARDLPGMADVDFSLLAFCKDIRKEVKVGLSGECADEIFGGYPWYRDPEIRALEGFPWAQNTGYRQSFLHPQLTGRVKGREFVDDCYQTVIHNADILPETPQSERRMRQMMHMNLTCFMQTLLDRKDRMSMYNGLEVRVPFCDYRIAEYLYSVPWEFKDYNGQEKGLLRHAMRGLLPGEVLWRKKSPYPKTWHPQYLQIVSDRLRQILDDPAAPIHSLARKEALKSLLTDEYLWPWYGQLMKLPQTIAYMLQINFWLSHYNVSIV